MQARRTKAAPSRARDRFRQAPSGFPPPKDASTRTKHFLFPKKKRNYLSFRLVLLFLLLPVNMVSVLGLRQNTLRRVHSALDHPSGRSQPITKARSWRPPAPAACLLPALAPSHPELLEDKSLLQREEGKKKYGETNRKERFQRTASWSQKSCFGCRKTGLIYASPTTNQSKHLRKA